jgi:hypothetical protein
MHNIVDFPDSYIGTCYSMYSSHNISLVHIWRVSMHFSLRKIRAEIPVLAECLNSISTMMTVNISWLLLPSYSRLKICHRLFYVALISFARREITVWLLCYTYCWKKNIILIVIIRLYHCTGLYNKTLCMQSDVN